METKEILSHYKYILRLSYKICKDYELAKDLTQDTFTRAFKYIHTCSDDFNKKGWLIRILRNTYSDRLRAKKDPCAVAGSNIPIEHFYDTKKAPAQFQKEYFTHFMGDEVCQAIDTLSPEIRKIFIWLYVDEYSYSDISKMVNMPEANLKSKMYVARLKLKPMLCDYAKHLRIKIN